jgi:hypothetical protein
MRAAPRATIEKVAEMWLLDVRYARTYAARACLNTTVAWADASNKSSFAKVGTGAGGAAPRPPRTDKARAPLVDMSRSLLCVLFVKRALVQRGFVH